MKKTMLILLSLVLICFLTAFEWHHEYYLFGEENNDPAYWDSWYEVGSTIELSDGSFLVTGDYVTPAGYDQWNHHGFMARFDSLGQLMWVTEDEITILDDSDPPAPITVVCANTTVAVELADSSFVTFSHVDYLRLHRDRLVKRSLETGEVIWVSPNDFVDRYVYNLPPVRDLQGFMKFNRGWNPDVYYEVTRFGIDGLAENITSFTIPEMTHAGLYTIEHISDDNSYVLAGWVRLNDHPIAKQMIVKVDSLGNYINHAFRTLADSSSFRYGALTYDPEESRLYASGTLDSHPIIIDTYNLNLDLLDSQIYQSLNASGYPSPAVKIGDWIIINQDLWDNSRSYCNSFIRINQITGDVYQKKTVFDLGSLPDSNYNSMFAVGEYIVTSSGYYTLADNGSRPLHIAKLHYTEIDEIIANQDEDVPISNTDNLTTYPNPFNPETTIEFTLTEPSLTELSVFNIKGQLVKSLVNQCLKSGVHKINWDGKNNSGQSSSSGIYFFKLEHDNETVVQKATLLK
ncbi:MAG: T9SS type A sorting domain-containing protein [Candidatus Cloacimonetes bacterium]|nr:T9SS type A sorting domain-containing protein [Candidatus Cloacimonadota bacterium]